jgi:hypothetical protein
MSSPHTDDTVIYLLLNPAGTKGIAAFLDPGSGNVFNVAFTSQTKAIEFIKKARRIGIPGFENMDRVAPSSVGEFFRWKANGKIIGGLAIDLEPETLDHPVFARSADTQN